MGKGISKFLELFSVDCDPRLRSDQSQNEFKQGLKFFNVDQGQCGRVSEQQTVDLVAFKVVEFRNFLKNQNCLHFTTH